MSHALKQSTGIPTALAVIVGVLAGSSNVETSLGVATGELNRSGQLVIALSLDGHAVRLLVDSGSSESLLDSRVARRLGFVIEPWVAGSKSAEVTGLGGTLETLGVTRVRELRIGDMKIQNMRFEVLDLALVFEDYDSCVSAAPDGFLGADFLRRFGAVLDFSSATLVAHNPRSREVTIRGHVYCVGEREQATLTLAGAIRDENSYWPVPSAVVSLRGESLGDAAATTDAAGAFEFKNLMVLETEVLLTGASHERMGGLASVPVLPGLISKRVNDWAFLLPSSSCPTPRTRLRDDSLCIEPDRSAGPADMTEDSDDAAELRDPEPDHGGID